MIALTVGGQVGSGGMEVGYATSRALGARYIQHLAIRRLARRLGATVEAVSRKELSFASGWDRFVAKAELIFERMGRYGYDPTGVMSLPLLAAEPSHLKSLPGQISDREYVDAVYATAAEFAAEGNLVLVKRAGSVTLRRFPEIIHVGLFAPRDARVARMARRLNVGTADAADAVDALELARKAWYRKLGGSDPADPSMYDLNFQTDLSGSDRETAGRIVEEAIGSRYGRTLNMSQVEAVAPGDA